MARLKRVSPDEATGKTSELYTAIKKTLGVVPNMMQTMGNSSAFLEGYLNLNGALGNGSLGAKIGELIALTVAETNSCDYCLSAHTYLGLNLVNIDADSLEAARCAESEDQRISAILKFTKAVVNTKGQVTDADVTAVKQAGVTEGEIAEIIGHVGLNVLTNYFNLVAKTEIEFPLVKAGTIVAA